MLLQEGRPVAFESRRYIPAERNYTVTEKEALSVVHALKAWRCYLEGHTDVTLCTDHNPNVHLPTQASLSRRQARWMEFLSRFHLQWVYKPGRINMADPLSRDSGFKTPSAAVARLAAMELRRSARKKQGIALKRKRAVALGPSRTGRRRPRPSPAPRPVEPDSEPDYSTRESDHLDRIRAGYEADAWFANQRNLTSLALRDGLWWKGDQLVIPNIPDIRTSIMHELHDAPYSGHLGVEKTLAAVHRHYWWPGITAYVRQYVRSCSSCQYNKATNRVEPGQLRPLQIPDAPFSSVGMDFITGLPPTRSGHDAILVFVCRLTKMVHFVPTTITVGGRATAELYRDNVFKLHGLAAEFVSDRGTQFNNAFMHNLTRLLGTKQSLSTAFHPQTDGQTERTNRVLEEMLRHFTSPRQDDWDEYLSLAEFAVNNAKQASTGQSPFYLVYGRHPRTPADITPLPAKTKQAPAADEFAAKIKQGIEDAKRSLQSAQARQKHYYDKGVPELTLTVGQQVLLNTKNLSLTGPGPRKLLPRWIGPFTVTKALTPVTYTLDLPDTMKIHPTFHVSLLRPYVASGRVQPPLPAYLLGEDQRFAVEHVVAHRSAGAAKLKYLVKWKGHGDEHNTWETEETLIPSEGGNTLRRYWAYIGQPLPRSLSNKLGDRPWRDYACEVCRSTDEPNMLLCDACDTGWHMHCLEPPVHTVPDGDWLCPRCRSKVPINPK